LYRSNWRFSIVAISAPTRSRSCLRATSGRKQSAIDHRRLHLAGVDDPLASRVLVQTVDFEKFLGHQLVAQLGSSDVFRAFENRPAPFGRSFNRYLGAPRAFLSMTCGRAAAVRKPPRRRSASVPDHHVAERHEANQTGCPGRRPERLGYHGRGRDPVAERREAQPKEN
jgi:hypothetical protein